LVHRGEVSVLEKEVEILERTVEKLKAKQVDEPEQPAPARPVRAPPTDIRLEDMPAYYEFISLSTPYSKIMSDFFSLLSNGINFTKIGRKGSPHRRLMRVSSGKSAPTTDIDLIDSLMNLSETYLFW
jgi:hypothetical protein